MYGVSAASYGRSFAADDSIGWIHHAVCSILLTVARQSVFGNWRNIVKFHDTWLGPTPVSALTLSTKFDQCTYGYT